MYKILNDTNHNSGGNPHEQYVLKDIINKIPLGSYANKYIKVGSIYTYADKNHPYFNGELDIIGGNVGNYQAQRGKFGIFVRLNSDTKTCYNCLISYNESFQVMNENDLKLVTNYSNNKLSIDIYCKVYFNNNVLGFRWNFTNFSRMEFEFDNYTFVDIVPTNNANGWNVGNQFYNNTIKTSTLTLSNSWVSNSVGGTPKLIKLNNKRVSMCGTIGSGVVTNGTVICTIPDDFLPDENKVFIVHGYGVGYVLATAIIKVNKTNKNITIDKYFESGVASTNSPIYLSFECSWNTD